LNPKKIIIYADGGARGNPGPAGAGAYLEDQDGKELAQLYRYLGETTNNVAEYTAFIMALQEAKKRGIPDLEIYLDSELIVRQIEGTYRVKKPHLKKLYDQALALLENFPHYQIQHIPREQNQEADRLANFAIDKHFGSSK